MDQEVRIFSTGREKLQYLLFLPEAYGHDPAKRWPWILFLHGAGERGKDPEVLKRHGIPRIVTEQPGFPFLAISPQCPEASSWTHHLQSLHSLIDEIQNHFAVDADRLYLTGMSMGGNGVWMLAVRHPDRFAAIAPVCGYGLSSDGFPERVCVLKDVPVWVFHGEEDDVVPISQSRILVQTLQTCGGQVRFTSYPNTGHDSWTRTYGNPEIFDWFLSHSLVRSR